MNKRTILFNNGDFRLIARLASVPSPKDGYALTITSRRKESKAPLVERIQFFSCLDRQGLQALAKLIQNELDSTATTAEPRP